MTDQYIGEIRMFASSYAPVNWALCDGQLLPVRGNESLFALLGTTYGGDGMTTFGLPDLRGRIPMGDGQGLSTSTYHRGQTPGFESINLTTNQIPQHIHSMMACTEKASTIEPDNRTLGTIDNGEFYEEIKPETLIMTLNEATIQPTGAGQPHNNMMPTQCVNFIIAIKGLYPPRD